MDIIMKSKRPEVNIEYFGQQSRFFNFFEMIVDDLLHGKGIYAETNSGSNGNAFMYAKKGYQVITNDASEYSYSVAKAIMSDNIPTEFNSKYEWLNKYSDSYIGRASVFASVVDLYGYNAEIPSELNSELEEKINEYISYFTKIKNEKIRSFKSYNEDLYNYLRKLRKEKINVDIMFMDFAWPWRDGSKTEEYNTTANIYSNIFEKSKIPNIEIWDKKNVIDNVIKAVKEAKKISKYVLLSNQSSNYPTPEVLEVALLKNGLNYDIRHTMLTDAEYEDNLGKESFFREYLYVIRGDVDD
ncbi:MAG: hypothetical protein PUA90_03995 [bacterium]|nr:hypothetical protein [bacterium]